MRILLFTSIIVVLSSSPVFAAVNVVEQVDWSGGGGVLGPVSEWGNRFFSATDIYWHGVPGRIFIMMIAKHHIDTGYLDTNFAVPRDINGDGFEDVIATDPSGRRIFWYQNNDGSGLSWTKRNVANNLDGPICVNSEDIDGDGDMDIIAAIWVDDEVIWWENANGSGTSWTVHNIDNTCNGPRSIHSVDMDKDGDIDVVVSAYSFPNIMWWENSDGLGTSWIRHPLGITEQARSVHARDIDGDDDMDIVCAYFYGDQIAWWENIDSTGTGWMKHVIASNCDHPWPVYSDDIDGDGDTDVLGATYGSHHITWWENEYGTGMSWIEHTIGEGFGNASCVYSEDLDGDGDIDVLGAAQGTDEITWWENSDSTGEIWIEHTLDEDFSGAICVRTADFNNDGSIDVLGAASFSGIAWYDVSDSSSIGVLESSILEVSQSPDWHYFQWASSQPADTEVMFQLRASDDPGSMGPWSDTLWLPDSLDGVVQDEKPYFQYKVIMTSSNYESTPYLYQVSLFWEPYTGIEEENHAGEYSLFNPRPNPSSSETLVRFNVPEYTAVDLTIFDLSGRLIESSHANYEAGMHQIAVDDLPPGVYIVRMSSNLFTFSKLFTVLN